MDTRRLIKPSIIIPILILLAGCANARYGRTVIDDQARQIFESYQILSDYRYYYSGSDVHPDAVIAIDSAFTLTTSLWKPVTPTPDQMKNWFNWLRPRVGWDLRPYGRAILSDNGKRIGLWYSVVDWRDHTVVKMIDDHTVEISPPMHHIDVNRGGTGLYDPTNPSF
jgi:hypothetical protein